MMPFPTEKSIRALKLGLQNARTSNKFEAYLLGSEFAQHFAEVFKNVSIATKGKINSLGGRKEALIHVLSQLGLTQNEQDKFLLTTAVKDLMSAEVNENLRIFQGALADPSDIIVTWLQKFQPKNRLNALNNLLPPHDTKYTHLINDPDILQKALLQLDPDSALTFLKSKVESNFFTSMSFAVEKTAKIELLLAKLWHPNKRVRESFTINELEVFSSNINVSSFNSSFQKFLDDLGGKKGGIGVINAREHPLGNPERLSEFLRRNDVRTFIAKNAKNLNILETPKFTMGHGWEYTKPSFTLGNIPEDTRYKYLERILMENDVERNVRAIDEIKTVTQLAMLIEYLPLKDRVNFVAAHANEFRQHFKNKKDELNALEAIIEQVTVGIIPFAARLSEDNIDNVINKREFSKDFDKHFIDASTGTFSAENFRFVLQNIKKDNVGIFLNSSPVKNAINNAIGYEANSSYKNFHALFFDAHGPVIEMPLANLQKIYETSPRIINIQTQLNEILSLLSEADQGKFLVKNLSSLKNIMTTGQKQLVLTLTSPAPAPSISQATTTSPSSATSKKTIPPAASTTSTPPASTAETTRTRSPSPPAKPVVPTQSTISTSPASTAATVTAKSTVKATSSTSTSKPIITKPTARSASPHPDTKPVTSKPWDCHMKNMQDQKFGKDQYYKMLNICGAQSLDPKNGKIATLIEGFMAQNNPLFFGNENKIILFTIINQYINSGHSKTLKGKEFAHSLKEPFEALKKDIGVTEGVDGHITIGKAYEAYAKTNESTLTSWSTQVDDALATPTSKSSLSPRK